MQDTLCLVAPYPFRVEPLEDFDPLSDFDMTGNDDVWYARPQFFFWCTLCPTGQMGDSRGSHREVSLVFFSTFEPIDLGRDSVLQRNGIPMLYERAASQLPTLHVPSGKCSWPCSADAVLHDGEHAQHNSARIAV